jgi:hypothetical protein
VNVNVEYGSDEVSTDSKQLCNENPNCMKKITADAREARFSSLYPLGQS